MSFTWEKRTMTESQYTTYVAMMRKVFDCNEESLINDLKWIRNHMKDHSLRPDDLFRFHHFDDENPTDNAIIYGILSCAMKDPPIYDTMCTSRIESKISSLRRFFERSSF